MRWVLAVVVTSGCGRIAFDPRSDASSTTPDVIADAATPACLGRWLAGPTFSAAQRVASLQSAGEERDPFLTSDGLEIYFERDGDIVHATRTAPGATFGAPVPAPDLSSPVADYKLSMTEDGLEVFESRENGSANVDIWRATRASTADPFTGGAFVAELSTTDHDFDAFITRDGLQLYDSAQRPGSRGFQDVRFYERANRQALFTGPTVLPELSTADDDADGALTVDQRLIVFSRDFGGNESQMLFATRPGGSGPFSSPTVLSTLDAVGQDADPALSPDACEVFFASNRAGGMGFDLYRTTVL